jgi:hypothetical protein
MKLFAVVLTALCSFLVTAPRVDAQTVHAASQSVLDAAVQQHVSSADADRQLVQRLLDRADVQAVAGGAGIDIRSAVTAVRSMDPASLADVASQARTVDQALAGGQSRVTINTTFLIIGLLVLILLIVALK